MGSQCRDCRDGWEHCHGTLIVHGHLRAECTDDECPAPVRLMHQFVVDCEAVGCVCGADGLAAFAV